MFVRVASRIGGTATVPIWLQKAREKRRRSMKMLVLHSAERAHVCVCVCVMKFLSLLHHAVAKLSG